jgi:hypothetical protein
MMCQEVIELMQRYLDRDLDDIEYAQMLGHLKQCPDCTGLFQRLMTLSNELENLPKVTPAFSLVDAILPRLQHIEPASAADHMAAGLASEAVQLQVLQNENVTVTELEGWRSRMRGFVSTKIVGGVVAVGLILGFFVFEQQQQHSMENADGLLTPSAASSSKATDSAKRDSSPAPNTDSSGANNVTPSTPSTSAPLDSSSPQPTQPAETKSAGSAKDLIPPSNAPIQQGAAANPATTPGSGKVGSSSESAKPNTKARSFLPTAPASPNSGAQAPSSIVPQAAGGGFADLKEPMTFGAQSPSSGAAKSNAAASPPASAGGAAAPVPTPAPALKEQPLKDASPTYQTDGSAGGSRLKASEMGISSLRSTDVKSSSDGAYTASVNEKQQVVISDKFGTVVFTGRSWGESDKIILGEWSSDNKLTYQISNQSGTMSYAMNPANKTEAKK